MCSALLRDGRCLRHSRSVFAYRHMRDGWNKWKRGKRGETPDLCAGKARQAQQDQQHQSLLSLAPSVFCRLACETATAEWASKGMSLCAATVCLRGLVLQRRVADTAPLSMPLPTLVQLRAFEQHERHAEACLPCYNRRMHRYERL